jgi:hypothetical protein
LGTDEAAGYLEILKEKGSARIKGKEGKTIIPWKIGAKGCPK